MLDASAVLALVFGEPGADAVAERLPFGLLSAANYAEVLARSVERGRELADATADIGLLRLSIWPFDAELAVIAASLRPTTKALGLSLADRACLALGIKTGFPVLTADRKWLEASTGADVRCIR